MGRRRRRSWKRRRRLGLRFRDGRQPLQPRLAVPRSAASGQLRDRAGSREGRAPAHLASLRSLSHPGRGLQLCGALRRRRCLRPWRVLVRQPVPRRRKPAPRGHLSLRLPPSLHLSSVVFAHALKAQPFEHARGQTLGGIGRRQQARRTLPDRILRARAGSRARPLHHGVSRQLRDISVTVSRRVPAAGARLPVAVTSGCQKSDVNLRP